MRLDVSPNPAARAAAAIAREIAAGRGMFHLALSGGSAAGDLCRALTAIPTDWARVHVWQVDERLAPRDHPARNLTVLRAELDGRVQLHPMPVEEPDADVRYAAVLPPLDLAQLGLGVDGHTASLFPGAPGPGADVHFVGEHGGWRRLTLGLGPLQRAGTLVWLVRGPEKRAILARLLARDPGIPASALWREDAVVYCDEAAAG